MHPSSPCFWLALAQVPVPAGPHSAADGGPTAAAAPGPVAWPWKLRQSVTFFLVHFAGSFAWWLLWKVPPFNKPPKRVPTPKQRPIICSKGPLQRILRCMLPRDVRTTLLPTDGFSIEPLDVIAVEQKATNLFPLGLGFQGLLPVLDD